MDNLEKYITDFADNCGKLKYNQVVLGQEEHPKRTKNKDVPPGYSLKSAHGQPLIKMGIVAKGKCIIGYNEKAYALSEGEIIIKNHDVNTYEAFYDKNESYEVISLYYQTTFQIKIIKTYYMPGEKFKLLSAMTMKMDPKAYSLLKDIFLKENQKKEFPFIKKNICEWFNIVKNNITGKKYESRIFSKYFMDDINATARKIQKSNEYIKQHFKEPITLKKIAEQSFLSPAYFCVLFKKAYDQSIFEYIRHLRLGEACNLLRESSLNVNQISMSVGYENTNFFIRLFKKYNGVTPLEYRRRIAFRASGFPPSP